MPPDLSPYYKHLETWDASDKEKEAFLLALYTILESFVDRAFGEHPAQQVKYQKSSLISGEFNSKKD